ncbi:MAG: transcriptional activator [Chthonomonadales bacterium]|nr:transcriptional activator [Chthonomonadales bacterium]
MPSLLQYRLASKTVNEYGPRLKIGATITPLEDTTDLPYVWQVKFFGEMAFYRKHSSETTFTPVPIRFKTSKARLLLAYLLLHANQPHNREHLAALFWPENGETDRSRLRDALTSIRNGLRESGIPEEVLVTTNFTVCAVLSDMLRTDVAAFDAALRQAETRRFSQVAAERVAALEEAVALYRGPLLRNEVDIKEAEEWITHLRYQYDLRLDEALSQLYTLYASEGDVEQALFHARRYAENSSADTERAETVRALSERLHQTERTVAMRRLEERTSSRDSVSSAPPESAVTPSKNATPQTTHIPAPTETMPPAYLTSSLSTVEHRRHAPIRNRRLFLVSALATAALIGVLGGVFISRTSVKTMLPKRPHVSYVPGVLTEPNSFDAPGAQEWKEEDYEGALGHCLTLLSGTTDRTDRLQIARKILELGHSTHYRDIGKGLVATAACEAALRVFRAEKSREGTADTLMLLAEVLLLRGDRKRSVECVKEASKLALTVDPDLTKADMLHRIAQWAVEVGEYKLGKTTLDQSMAFFQAGATSEHQRGIAFVMWTQGCCASYTGDYKAAKNLLTEAAARMVNLPNQSETRAAVLGDLGDVYAREGDRLKAQGFYEEGLREWERKDQKFWMSKFKARLADMALWRAEEIAFSTQTRPLKTASSKEAAGEAERLCHESLALLEASNGPVVRARPLLVLSRVRYYQGQYGEARNMLRESIDLRNKVGNPSGIAEGLEALALFESQLGENDAACRDARDAETRRAKAGTPLPLRNRKTIADMRAALGLPPL